MFTSRQVCEFDETLVRIEMFGEQGEDLGLVRYERRETHRSSNRQKVLLMSIDESVYRSNSGAALPLPT